MMVTRTAACITAFIWAGAAAAAPDDESARMLERIAALAGDWSGTFQWSGGRNASGALDARYEVTGNGSAVVEHLLMGGKPFMTSVYHLDGAELRMTHFCAAGNQPRLRAGDVNAAEGRADFQWIDITNVGPKNGGHVEEFSIRIAGEDELELVFVFEGAGPRAVETIKLSRLPLHHSVPPGG
jgi:hypothetical protein